MDKGVIEDKHLDAESLCLADAVAHDIVDNPDVASARYDDTDAHTTLYGLAKSLEHRARWYKVGRREGYLALCAVDDII